ncbi:MAG: efflux RND transporter periplasmic adaptor subunit [Pseudomonadota bacterium]
MSQTDQPQAEATDSVDSKDPDYGAPEASDQPASDAPRAGKSLWRRAGNAVAVVTVAALCVGAIIGGVMAIKVRADADQSLPANPPVRVNTARIALQDTYRVGQNFVGRLEPTRETALAFELPGTVLKVSVEEGDKIAAGATVATLDTARLKTRKQELAAQRQELEARLSLANATAKRQRTLNRRGWAAAQRFDEARFQVAEIRAALKRIDASEATVDVDLAKSTLTAPFAGRVASRQIDEGAIVSAGGPVVTLLENGKQRIRVGVARSASSKLRPDASYQFRAGDRLFNATLVALRPDLDGGSRTVTALFETSSAETLPFGTVVTLELSREIDETGAWVPTASLSEGAKGIWTLLTVTNVDGAEIVRREAVELIHIADDRAFVRGSMPDGTQYIIDGINRVTPGQRVALLTQD